jgi:PAS domain S-box-containing protein
MNGETGDWRAEGPGGLHVPAGVPAFPFPVPEAGHGHAVRFYRDDRELLVALADFLSPGLASGEAALVLASPELRSALPAALAERGIDARAAAEGGQLLLQDAREAFERVFSQGRPDEHLFMRAIGGLIAKASAGRPALRAFAGMGPWAETDPAPALELERLWGKLGRTVAFSLLCAYPLAEFRGRGEGFGRICEAHDSAFPCAPFRPGTADAGTLRQAAELQLRIAELEGAAAEGGRAAEAPQRDLAEAAPALLWAAGPDGRRTYVNRAWLEFTGNDARRELERGMEGVHPGDREAVEGVYARALAARAGFRTEFRYRRRDGAWRWLINTGAPRLGPDGSFQGFVGACIDVTERKAAEERTRQARNLEAVGRLAGGLAHDFNNLLTAINGYSEIGLSLAPAEGPLRDFLGEIRRAGERASELTRELLAYGRKQILAPAVFDLNGTLDDMDRMLRRLLGDGIRLERRPQAGLGCIQADPGQIQQLILGLALNAREAMGTGGVLEIGTADLISAMGPEATARPYVLLMVRDDGAGMTAETRDRVFEPYFTTKGHRAGSPEGAGTGLGLASAYGTVRQSGGFITVESEAGKGSAFRVHFPWIDPEAGKPAQAEGALPARPITALVAVAEESLRRFLVRALSAEGFGALEAVDPETAVAASGAGSLDLLIAEDPCGGMRAPALWARLKDRHPALRALAIPASPEAAGVPGPTGAEGFQALELPLLRADLMARVRRALGLPLP